MRIRRFPLFLALLAGCRAAEVGETPPATVVMPATRDVKRGETTKVTPAGHQEPADDGLNLAAACLEKGDSAGAIAHLRAHAKRFPEQIMIRAYLAELLFKSEQWADAQDNFERFIAAAQDAEGPAKQHIVHCHTRLMEIAQNRDDDYGEHLHRGIGMVLLVRRLDQSGAGSELEPGFRERILCKAAGELTRANRYRPDEPRPFCYLVEVWSKLEQPRSREQAALKAKERMAFLPLPPAEQRAVLAVTR